MTDLPVMSDLPELPRLPELPAEDKAPEETVPAVIPAEVILPPLPGEAPSEEPGKAAEDTALIPVDAVPAEIILPENGEAEAILPTADDNNELIPLTTIAPTQPNSEFRIPNSAFSHCTSRLDLANAMADAWDAARQALITGTLAEALDACDLVAAAICRDQTANIASGRYTPDRAVLEAIRRLSEMPLVVWCGRRYAGASDLGGSLLQALRGTGAIPQHLDSLLRSGAASVFGEPAQHEALAAIEARYAAPDCVLRERLLLMYMVGFLLGGVAAFVMNGETFYTVEELADWLEACCRRSPAAFTRACHRLLDENHLLAPQLEAWLTALGRRQDVQKWQAEIDAGML